MKHENIYDNFYYEDCCISVLNEKGLFRTSRPEVFFTKRCSENFHQFYRRTPIQSVILINLQSIFIEITLWHGCSSVNLLYLFRTLFLRIPLDGLFHQSFLLIKFWHLGSKNFLAWESNSYKGYTQRNLLSVLFKFLLGIGHSINSKFTKLIIN